MKTKLPSLCSPKLDSPLYSSHPPVIVKHPETGFLFFCSVSGSPPSALQELFCIYDPVKLPQSARDTVQILDERLHSLTSQTSQWHRVLRSVNATPISVISCARLRQFVYCPQLERISYYGRLNFASGRTASPNAVSMNTVPS